MLKLEISYGVIIYLEGFWFFFKEDYFLEDYIFCMVKYLSLDDSSSFALRYILF